MLTHCRVSSALDSFYCEDDTMYPLGRLTRKICVEDDSHKITSVKEVLNIRVNLWIYCKDDMLEGIVSLLNKLVEGFRKLDSQDGRPAGDDSSTDKLAYNYRDLFGTRRIENVYSLQDPDCIMVDVSDVSTKHYDKLEDVNTDTCQVRAIHKHTLEKAHHMLSVMLGKSVRVLMRNATKIVTLERTELLTFRVLILNKLVECLEMTFEVDEDIMQQYAVHLSVEFTAEVDKCTIIIDGRSFACKCVEGENRFVNNCVLVNKYPTVDELFERCHLTFDEVCHQLLKTYKS